MRRGDDRQVHQPDDAERDGLAWMRSRDAIADQHVAVALAAGAALESGQIFHIARRPTGK